MGGPGVYGIPYFAAMGPFGGYGFYPGIMISAGGLGYNSYPWMTTAPMPVRGPVIGSPPLKFDLPEQPQNVGVPHPSDTGRARQQLLVGDRLFRAGNLKKAEERYRLALKADSNLAAPHLRLAQVALVRGNYTLAVSHLREAETAQPGWIETAPDIQSIYAEPADFAHQIARLESHVQIHPNDRDAWLILGAQWFLSGRTDRAADVFLRLDDPNRKPDLVLSAFLQASNKAKLIANKAN